MCIDTSAKHLKVCSPANTLRLPALRFSLPYPILSVKSVHRNQNCGITGNAGECSTIV